MAGIDIDAKLEYQGAVRAIDRLERRGAAAVDRTMRKVADQVARDAIARGGGKYGDIRVVSAGENRYAVVSMQKDGRHIGNYHNYGTLGSRRPKAKRPGTIRDHSAKGIKRKRFMRKPPKKKLMQMIVDATNEVIREEGFSR